MMYNEIRKLLNIKCGGADTPYTDACFGYGISMLLQQVNIKNTAAYINHERKC